MFSNYNKKKIQIKLIKINNLFKKKTMDMNKIKKIKKIYNTKIINYKNNSNKIY